MRAPEPLLFWALWAVLLRMSAEAEPQRVVGFSVSVLPPPLARPCRDEQPASPLAQLLQHQGQLLRRPLSVRTCCNRRGEDQRSKATLIQMGTPTSVFERGSSDSASSSVVSTPAIVIPDTARAIRSATPPRMRAANLLAAMPVTEMLSLADAGRFRKRARILRLATSRVCVAP